MNLRLKLDLALEKPHVEAQPDGGQDPSPAYIGSAEVVYLEGLLITPLYHRELLSTGNRIAGPALVIQMDTTTVVSPGWGGSVDSYGNLILEPN